MMPSKLKKAIAVVKDQTSISMAMVKTRRTTGGDNNKSRMRSWSVEVAILKATSHDDSPVRGQLLDDILRMVASSRCHASVCARCLGRRVGRTRSSRVALKSLLVVLHLLQHAPSHFPRDLLHASKTGYKILDLHHINADSFLRSLASYLNARLLLLDPTPCLLVRDTPPAFLLDRLPRWQRLLQKAIDIVGPTPPPTGRLVLSALHAVVRDTFELYRDISDGLALLLDRFFNLPHPSRVSALDACAHSTTQFHHLRHFYHLCISLRLGTPSHYPDVNTIPNDLIHTLTDFLKDQTDHEEAEAMLHGSTQTDQKSHQDTSDDQTARGWELALIQNASMNNSDAGFPTSSLHLNHYNPFLQHDPSPTCNLGFNVPQSHDGDGDDGDDDLFRMLAYDTAYASTTELQPNFWVDFNDPATPLDNANKVGDSIETGANSSLPNAFDEASFHAGFANMDLNANVTTWTGIAPSDQFTSLDCRLEDANEELAQLRAGSNIDKGLDPWTAIVPAKVQVESNKLSSAPTFTATPWFEAASKDNEEQHQQQNGRGDPLGPSSPSNYQVDTQAIVDQQNVKNQQEMWLEIQSRILAKHLT